MSHKGCSVPCHSLQSSHLDRLCCSSTSCSEIQPGQRILSAEQGKAQLLYMGVHLQELIQGVELRLACPSVMYMQTVPTTLEAGRPASISRSGLVFAAGLPHTASHDLVSVPHVASRDTVSANAVPWARQLDCCARCVAPNATVEQFDRHVLNASPLRLHCFSVFVTTPGALSLLHAHCCAIRQTNFQEHCCARAAAACPQLTSEQAAAHSPAQAHHSGHTAAACPCCDR